MAASREHRQRLYEQMVGQNIAGRFEITSLLGFGGMGAVYQAVQRNMQRDVALKVIPSHDPTTSARFKREALTISKLHHPNTVTVFDYGETDQGLLFLAMEMLSGQTLSDLIEQHGPMSPNQAVHIASQVCRSLNEAHQSDIVHRDIKPDNIFLIEVDNDPNFVKVLDFGIAKIVRGEDNVELTGTGRIIGTPKYMSPEQILAEPVDHRSDIYSLACIVFEMLCGSPPFQDSSTTKLMLAHAHQAPPTFSERLPNQALSRIPGPLEQVVRRALSKSPAQRQPSIDAFREELQEALEATDHELRISELTAQTQTGQSPTQMHPAATATATGANDALTDSSDLLAQHSSQTLSKLKPPTSGHQSAPTAVNESEDTSGSSLKAPLVALGVVLLLLGGLGAYMAFGPKQEDAGQAEQADAAEAGAQVAAAETQQPEMHFEEATAGAEKEAEPATVKIEVVTEPGSAHVFDEGVLVGKTPLKLDVEPGTTLAYEFERPGFLPQKATFTVEANDPSPRFEVILEKKREKTQPRRPERTRVSTKPPKKDKKTAAKPDESAEADKEQEKDVRPNVFKLEDDKPNANVEMLDD
ncbi:hypothetical protein FIV42_26270 [Persicimonas caeni]|uniref:non-specific serine/threonine protein kinase n=1 Tax=Persicimonas caeni TaxID=2292766 RepID=A0A4Y6Q0V9_PERCE|nr:serine/threonine-protein kinase [Persicimonas caeni]QDG54120.1 hypothetical protein FIV42_26270 [Persicimonas caeni]QED35341.1 protein kinase [Persicimonas caeni]